MADLGNAERDQLVRAKAGSAVKKPTTYADEGRRSMHLLRRQLAGTDVASFLIRFNGPPMAWHTYSIIVDLERPVEIVALEEVLGRPTSD